MATSIGDRIALIRQAIGTIQRPISQEELGALVQERTGEPFDKYKVSRLERGAQELSRADAIAIATVDPRNRGPAWLMFGDQDERGDPARTNPTPDLIGPTVQRVLPKQVSRLDDGPERAKGKGGKRPPKGRTALAS